MNLIPEPYRLLAGALLWLASLFAVGVWQHHAGAVGERVAWQAKEVTEQAAAAAQLKALSDAARAAEQKHAADMAALAADYERKLSDANKQRAADIAAVRAGTLRLRDKSGTCVPASTDPGAKAGPSSGIGNGTTGCELSETTSGFLLDFANDADDIARQLAACQQVIVQDRLPP